jgi:transposase
MQSTPTVMMPVILQRLAGSLTATQAARQLGISRKTYYQWEARALRGMKAALEPGRPGRRSKPDPALAQVEAQKQELQQRLDVLEQRLYIKECLARSDTRAKKK